MEFIRKEKLFYCTGAAYLLGICLLYAGIWSLDLRITPSIFLINSLNVYFWVACGLFFAGASLCLLIIPYSVRLAGWVLCLFVSAGIFTLLPRFQNGFAITSFLVPILFSALVFDLKNMIIYTGLVLSASIGWNLYYFYGQDLIAHVFTPGLIVFFASAFIALTVYSLFSTLSWYEENYILEKNNRRIIRDSEIKLERLVKALETQKESLKTSNALLAVALDQAEQAKRAKQIFVQNVSHELLSPLNLIIGFAETMVNTPKAYAEVNWTPELQEDVDCIYQNSQHLKDLIDDVLKLAALEYNSFEIQPSNFNLHHLIRETVQIRRESFNKKGLSIHYHLGSDPMLVYADPTRIKQVILNLLSNVLKATEIGGVSISTDRVDGFAMVYIKDTGRGIPEYALEKVFEVFYQVDKSTISEDTGTGLGLSISKALVELNGGKIDISSQVGVGTVISFTLPLAR